MAGGPRTWTVSSSTLVRETPPLLPPFLLLPLGPCPPSFSSFLLLLWLLEEEEWLVPVATALDTNDWPSAGGAENALQPREARTCSTQATKKGESGPSSLVSRTRAGAGRRRGRAAAAAVAFSSSSSLAAWAFIASRRGGGLWR